MKGYLVPLIYTSSSLGLASVNGYTFSVPFVGITAGLALPPPIGLAFVPATALTELLLMVIFSDSTPQPEPIPEPPLNSE